MLKQRKGSLQTATIIFVVLCLAILGYRFYSQIDSNPIDYKLFLQEYQKFEHSGKLYRRSDNLLKTYRPSAAVFKFPPPYQLINATLSNIGALSQHYILLKFLLLLSYIGSIAILLLHYSKAHQLSDKKFNVFVIVFAFIAAFVRPFYEAIDWILIEIIFLLIITLAITQNSTARKNFFLGGLIGYVSAAKIYPAFIASHFIFTKNRAAIAGLISFFLLSIAISLVIFGATEHKFYIENILPILLDEKISTQPDNLNIEKFLYAVGIIESVDGKLFRLTQILILAGTLWLLIGRHEQLSIFPGISGALLVTAMFFCFPNYWDFYQILLLIPVAALISSSLKNPKSMPILLLALSLLPLLFSVKYWPMVMEWELSKANISPQQLEQLSHESGLFCALSSHLPATAFTFFMFEARALTPLGLWMLQAHYIFSMRHPNPDSVQIS